MEIKKISKEQANEMLKDMIEGPIIHSEVLEKWEKYLEKTKLEECIDRLRTYRIKNAFGNEAIELESIIEKLQLIEDDMK